MGSKPGAKVNTPVSLRVLKRMQELIAALGNSDHAIAIRAESLLIRHYASRAYELLRAAAVNADLRVRFRVAWILGFTGDERALETLLTLTEDPVGEVRYDAVLALGHLGDRRAIGPLLMIMSTEGSEASTDSAAVGALHKLGSIAVPALLNLLATTDSVIIKTKITKAFFGMKDESLVELIAALLTIPDDYLRITVIEALDAIGSSRCRIILEGLRDDPSEKVRKLARYYCDTAAGVT